MVSCLMRCSISTPVMCMGCAAHLQPHRLPSACSLLGSMLTSSQQGAAQVLGTGASDGRHHQHLLMSRGALQVQHLQVGASQGELVESRAAPQGHGVHVQRLQAQPGQLLALLHIQALQKPSDQSPCCHFTAAHSCYPAGMREGERTALLP